MITAATLCSGIGAPEAAMPEWRWLWCAEVDPFPSAVLQKRYGHPNLGDITGADFSLRAAAVGIPDVIVAGTPCQAFSIAGKREGLADDRGNLTLVFTRIIHDLAVAARHAGRRPPVILWENVPGVLSDDTNAFGCFLGEIVGADDALQPPRGESWPDQGMVSGPRARIAWRILDAQHCGLAQRRERVFAVVDLGDGADPAAVLFERKGLPRDYTPRVQTREKSPPGTSGAVGRGSLWGQVAAAFADPRFGVQEKAGTLGGASQSGGFRTTDLDNNGAFIPEVAWALQERDHKGADSDTKEGHLIPVAFKSSHYTRGKDGAPQNIAPPLSVEDDRGDQSPLILAPQAVALNLRGRDGGAMPEIDDKASLRAASGGSSRSYVATTQGEELDGETPKAGSVEILRLLRKTVGEAAFTEWGLGIVAALRAPEILQSSLYGLGLRSAADSRNVLDRSASARPKTCSERAVLAVLAAGRDGCPSQGWQLPEQLAEQLGASLSVLPQSRSQRAAFLHDLSIASQGIGVLREALSALQEVRKPAFNKNQPAHIGWAVRRLTPTEAARLQGFPDDQTRIEWRGKPASQCPDGPQYKGYGNSMAVPVIRWICKRIELSIRGEGNERR